jgi:hypothetical protein
MSETASTQNDHADHRDQRGRFIAGNTGNGGRPKGARSKLGEAFLEDLRDAWNAHGIDALRRCAVEEPSQFCRIVANLLPRDIDINVSHSLDAASFAERFRSALELLHSEPLPKIKTIEHADAQRR